MKKPISQGIPPEAIPASADATCDSTSAGTHCEVGSSDSTNVQYEFLSPALATGELGRMGGYRVLELLGQGGMGLVFRAEDPTLRRPVALKVLRPDVLMRATAAERFLREARAAASIKHDHIVTIYQVGQDRGIPFLALEFLQGEPLDVCSHREGQLPGADVRRIGHETALGLAAAHEAGLIHRDIKPANVWLEAPRGRVKILDFGLARAASEDVNLTGSGAVMGTPAYMSPEQANGQLVDQRTDLFSLGAMLYRLATGRLPFEGASAMAILAAMAMTEPIPPEQLAPQLPRDLAEVIKRLLRKQPGERIQTAWEVAELLAPPMQSVTIVTTPLLPEFDGSHFEFEESREATEVHPPRAEPAGTRPRPALSLRRVGLATSAILLLAVSAVALRHWTGRDVVVVHEPKSAVATPLAAGPSTVWPDAGFYALDRTAQVAAIEHRLRGSNPKWVGRCELISAGDGWVRIDAANLKSLTPVAALGWIEHLHFESSLAEKPTTFDDITPLRVLRLKSLRLRATRVSDLTAVADMPIRWLDIENSDVIDLKPLRLTRLWHLNVTGTPAKNWEPLRDLPLVSLEGPITVANGGSIRSTRLQLVRGVPNDPAAVRKSLPATHRQLEIINDVPAPSFWKDDTFHRASFAPLDPAWVAKVRGMKPDEQVAAVSAELRLRNPDWNGGVFGVKVEANGVVECGINTSGLRDLTPVAVLDRLLRLSLIRPEIGVGPLLTDLTPLAGLKLVDFGSVGNPLLDGAVLRSMPLKTVRLQPYTEATQKRFAADFAAIPTLQTVNDMATAK